MKNNPTIAVIGAMDCEIEQLKKSIKDVEVYKKGQFEVLEGKIGNTNVVLAKSGVGKAAAAMTVQLIADKFNPDYIINTGVAGGLAEDLSVGDVVVGEELVQHDFDATALGYAKGYMCTGFQKDKPTVFHADEKLIELFEDAAKKYYTSGKTHRGIIATGDMFMSDLAKRAEVKNLFNAKAVEMEGAAIAQAATANDIPFVVVRVISDLANGEAATSLDQFETEMAILSSKLVNSLIENI